VTCQRSRDGKELKRRVGIYEVMTINAGRRQMVGRGPLAEEIRASALGGGMIDLKRYAAILLTVRNDESSARSRA
jgi:type II secretory ATPase GspE/PulE/Tfp pilus assembly ATPase PilB-like protein